MTKTGGEAFGSGEFATAIAAYIHDESIAESEVLDDLVERALSHLVGEAAHVEVADVIVEDAVLGSRGDMVVGTEVTALQRIAEVRGVVLVPVPVASVVKGAVEVHMSVFQLGKHLGKYLEELVIVHRSFRAYLIYIIYSVPVEPVDLLFIVKETVVLVDDLPQGFEVSLGGIFVLCHIDARDCKNCQ